MKAKLLLKVILFFFVIIAIFSSCHTTTDKGMSQVEKDKYLINGEIIVKESFQALSSQLKKAIEREGIIGAIPYCHVAADPIIDSATEPYDVIVKRTSLKFRNPDNKPDSLEHNILTKYKLEMDEGIEPKDEVLVVSDSEARYFSPIYIQPLCLNCHGTVDREMMGATMFKIKELYPGDKATGYESGDLRGIWSITFKR